MNAMIRVLLNTEEPTQLKEPFDSRYLNELFKVGHDLGRKGHRWAKVPPGLATSGVAVER
jgi:hypothetical protein